MLVKNKYALELFEFIWSKQGQEIDENERREIILAHCQKQEEFIYEAIRSITITLPPGAIQVQTPSGIGSNIQPIVLTGVIK